MSYVVEKVFEHSGFVCVVAMMDMGHRCGYVGVPKSHKYYGKGYTQIEQYIDCHGGLTYSGGRNYPLADRNDLWWFGWDYAHSCDGIDWESFEKNFDREIVNRRRDWSSDSEYYGYIYSIESVEEDCKAVAEQMKEQKLCSDGKPCKHPKCNKCGTTHFMSECDYGKEQKNE